MAKPEQPQLPGVPKPVTTMFRINFQYASPQNELRSGTLIIEAEKIQDAKDKAVIKLHEKFNDKWHKITAIKSLSEEAPF